MPRRRSPIRCEVECPCGAINFYTDSGFEDLSKLDYEGIICWKCGAESIYETAELYHAVLNEDVEECFINLADGSEE